MCGIAGSIGPWDEKEGLSVVQRMNDTIVHRGPDDSGTAYRPGFAFAMRRLSIIDLQGGHQPMWTPDGVGIVYNGEIYNYRELRTSLEKKGYAFRTTSDTEVFLNLFHADGIDCLQKIEGMFAVCLYDPRTKKVFLARDRLGKKPLYYSAHENLFYFASEIKAILAGMGSKPGVSEQALHDYLTLRYCPGPRTIWEGIYKLQPGHFLTYDLEQKDFSTARYWHVEFYSDELNPARDYVKEFEQLFLSAVEKRLVASDVPVGVMLSGGLDSSAVSAAAVELGHRNFHTFNVSFKDGGAYSEASFAKEMAKRIGSQHHEIAIGQEEFLEFLPHFVWHTDEPLADLASIPLYYVSKLAHEHVKVALTGEGSDEIFAGYDMEAISARLDKIRSLTQWMPQMLQGLLSRNLADEGLPGYLKCAAAHITHHWTEEEKEKLWNDERGRKSTDNLIRHWYELTPSKNPIDQLQQVYCHSWLVEDLLMKADKMSMATSLELRVPFLDHHLVEWAALLPMEWKVGSKAQGYTSKRILREFARKRLPESIINRPKRGFPVPAYQWLKGNLYGWAKDMLNSPQCKLKDYFDLSSVSSVLDQAKEGDQNAAHKIWILIILEQWLKRWT